MTYLVGAIGVLCLLDLALTLVVVRRLRRHGEQLARRTSNGVRVPLLPAGTAVPGFAVTTVSGQIRSLGDMAGSRSVVAFLSPSCPPCRTQLPEFAAYARAIAGGAGQVLAVVSGDDDRALGFAREIEGVASIALEPPQGPAQKAFSVSGYPSFFTLDEHGLVESSAMSVRWLAAPELV